MTEPTREARSKGSRLPIGIVAPGDAQPRTSSTDGEWHGPEDERRTPYAPVHAEVLAELRRATEAGRCCCTQPIAPGGGRANPRSDLIVMGAQGRGGVELMLYGSNTQHVVRAATCPVFTVRA